MLSIGDFSKISGFSIKALRLYHEEGILVPKLVDKESGYRYYDYDNVERARIIALLRQMMFSIEDVKSLLANCNDDSDALDFLERHRLQLDQKIREMRHAKLALDRIIVAERKAVEMSRTSRFEIEEKTLPALKMAGIRTIGRYDDMGKLFSKLGRVVGAGIAGKPFGLFYDSEYKEEGAEFEACFPVKKEKAAAGVSFRDLEGGRAFTLIHQGPYEAVGRSYAKLLNHVTEKGFEVRTPSREVYVKGPGMIFKGNPEKYVTEIQVLVR